MKVFIYVVFGIVTFLSFSFTESAFYVAANGDDGGSGTSSHPFATIEKETFGYYFHAKRQFWKNTALGVSTGTV